MLKEKWGITLRLLVALLSLFVLVGCVPADWSVDPNTVFEDEEAYSAIDEAVVSILSKDYETLFTSAHSAFQEMDGIEDSLEDFLNQIPDLDPQKRELFYAHTYKGVAPLEGALMREALYDVSDGDNYILLTVLATEDEGKCCKVNHFRFEQMNTPRGEKVLSPEGKSLSHHIVLGLLVAMPIFMLTTAIFCGFSKKMKRKWLWIPFILVGLWGFEFNWTTGVFQNEFIRTYPNGSFYISLFQIHLLGAAFTKANLWAPWIITIGSPVGAVVFWFRYAFKKPPKVEAEF